MDELVKKKLKLPNTNGGMRNMTSKAFSVSRGVDWGWGS